jgi:hypothetical protein
MGRTLIVEGFGCLLCYVPKTKSPNRNIEKMLRNT